MCRKAGPHAGAAASGDRVHVRNTAAPQGCGREQARHPGLDVVSETPRLRLSHIRAGLRLCDLFSGRILNLFHLNFCFFVSDSCFCYFLELHNNSFDFMLFLKKLKIKVHTNIECNIQ